jgi:putative Mg2+ transporter-C (MgtC) family protein
MQKKNRWSRTSGRIPRHRIYDPASSYEIHDEIVTEIGRRMTDVLIFTLNVAVALLLGAALGVERQFRGHPAGLRVNALVCVGAAMFVSLSRELQGADSARLDPTRMAAYVVSGIGFLGGGVILREGFTVRGMNTAATLWCSAAIGVLSGFGLLFHAFVGTLIVLGVHIGLRPVARQIDARRRIAEDQDVGYRLRVVAGEKEQALIRTILLRHVNAKPTMAVQGISVLDAEEPGTTVVTVDIFSNVRNDRAMEELVQRLDIEPGIKAISWDRR